MLSRKQRATPAIAPIFDGEKEAKLIALACSKPPKGRARWTLRLLESKVVELDIVDRASDSTIGRVLKKTLSSPIAAKQWVIPPKANSAFVAAMEDVLAVYTRPRDPDRPLVCLDETSKQLIAETRVPIPMKPGRPARCDYEYERNGTANLFMMFAPLEGWRHVKVTDRHTAVDYAHVLKDLADSPLRQRQDHRPGPGQPQHPQQGVTLRSLPGRRSPSAGRALRMALHAKARQLARSGRVRTWRPIVPVPRPPHPRQTNPHRRKSPPGSTTEMPTTPRPIGTSQPPTLASNSSIYTLQSE